MAKDQKADAEATLASALAELRALARRRLAPDAVDDCLAHLDAVERALGAGLTGARPTTAAPLARVGQGIGQGGRPPLVATASGPSGPSGPPPEGAVRQGRMFLEEPLEGPEEADAAAAPRVIDGRALSRYQGAILRFVERGAGNGIVGAVAGSGKTSTLLLCAQALRTEALFLAFNARIARELEARLAGTRMVAKTIHSVGRATLAAALGRPMVDEKKYRALAELRAEGVMRAAGLGALASDQGLLRAVAATLYKLADFCRLTLTDPADGAAALEMAARYHLDLPDGDQGEDVAYRRALLDATVAHPGGVRCAAFSEPSGPGLDGARAQRRR